MKTLPALLAALLCLSAARPALSKESETLTRLIPKQGVPVVEKETVLMGTEVSALIQTADRARAGQAIEAAFREIARIEDLMTDWREPSQLMDINNAAGIRPVAVSPEIVFVLEQAKRISEITGGTFDVTYAGVGKLWRFTGENPRVPAADEIRKALPLVDYRKIILNPKANTVFLKKRGMRLGLGGIGKGYAVDRAMEVIGEHGFENYAIRAGGDMIVRGLKDGRLWSVAIRHPRDKARNIALLPVSNAAISTSGDTERYFELNGKRYAHILNPKTGYPADGCQIVTILAKYSYWADGIAKGVFIQGPEKGMELIESLEGVEGMIVDRDGKVSVSSGLQSPAQR